MIRFVDTDKKPPRQNVTPSDAQPERSPEIDELYRKLQPEMRRPKPSAEAIAAAFQAAQRLADEADAEESSEGLAQALTGTAAGKCRICGHQNRPGNRFCAMCGVPVGEPGEGEFGGEEVRPRPRAIALGPNPFLDDQEPQRNPPAKAASPALETHHYHHHYHHHYFSGGQEGVAPRPAESGREERLRPNAALRGEMSRTEAAVRSITQEWVLACNTKHLDDLLDLYAADALVLRSNFPPVRGAAAVREFFFAALDAGLGEVELEPLRVEVAGDLAYEAGRCKALVPSATGKRREERAKYLWVCARQGNGEWRLAADCWAADLTLTTLESDIPPGTAVKTGQPRRTP